MWDGCITLYYQNGAWTYIEDDHLSEGQIAVAPAPTAEELKELGLSVYVCCAENKHAVKNDFPLPADDQLTFTPAWNEKEHRGEYCVSLTAAAADSYVAQYSAAVGKNHTRIYTGNAILYWYDGAFRAIISRSVMERTPTAACLNSNFLSSANFYALNFPLSLSGVDNTRDPCWRADCPGVNS